MKTLAISCLIAVAASGCSPNGHEGARPLRGDAERGRAALAALECGACHVIPGVRGPRSHVGPSLDGFAGSVYIAGKFPNTPEILVRWLRDAPGMAPRTAMPPIAMSDAQADDIAAYLYTLE